MAPRDFIGTVLGLGLRNVARVATYRASVRLKVSRAVRARAPLAEPPYFKPVSEPARDSHESLTRPEHILAFGWLAVQLGDSIPDWHANLVTGAPFPGKDAPWWEIADFDPQAGDIKAVWERSRLDWAMAFAQRARLGDARAIDLLNSWLWNWSRANPPFRGPNWKCGQEASIRVMHLGVAALLLSQVRGAPAGLRTLIATHLQRVEPTLSYAIGQDNNHGTSEAGALFIGGSWLIATGDARGARWERLGRKWLENRAVRCIEPCGTFSQYSSNYQRLALDTFSLAESWRRHLGLPAFSGALTERVRAATLWMASLTDPTSGDVPNVGANDGACLLPLAGTAIRDFRPSVNLASALFLDRIAFAAPRSAIAWLAWLRIPPPTQQLDLRGSRVFADGGFAVLRRGDGMALLRFPRFRFRPSQADALHVDLWVAGECLLADGGTYSYALRSHPPGDLAATRSHNTIEFDARDQMPRLGRFLYGAWLREDSTDVMEDSGEASSFRAGYTDHCGVRHVRRVQLREGVLQVADEIAGFRERAVLRWRLQPGAWEVQGSSAVCGNRRLTFESSMPIRRIELTQGYASLHYLRFTPVPVVEVEMGRAGSITSTYRWA